MTVQVVPVNRLGTSQPRAVQIPARVLWFDLDVLYDFGFEWFGDDRGTERLISLDDDCLDDYDDARDVMRESGTTLALYDRDEFRWVPLSAGDWVIQPNDGMDGFIKRSDADFQQEWSVVSDPDV